MRRIITLVASLAFCLVALSLIAAPPVRIDFQGDQIGRFPSAWNSKDMGEAQQVYSVQAEGERRFLHADARDVSRQIGYETKWVWVLKEMPLLRWQWRALIFPEGSDERQKKGNDSVLAIYVLFGRWPSMRAIKYIWSDTLPLGTSLDSPYAKWSKMVVVRSRRAEAGQWITEERNVLADYNRLFGEGKESPVANGIAILTDSDNTRSRAAGDYAYIEIGPAEPQAKP